MIYYSEFSLRLEPAYSATSGPSFGLAHAMPVRSDLRFSDVIAWLDFPGIKSGVNAAGFIAGGT